MIKQVFAQIMIQYHQPGEPYTADRRSSLTTILRFIKKSSGLPVVLTNGDGSLFGIVSSGDIADYLAQDTLNSLEHCVAEDVANREPVVAHLGDSQEVIEGYLSQKKIRVVPVIDSSQRVVRVLSNQDSFFKVGSITLDSDSPPLLIAEIGVNHNGEVEEAKWLIQQAAAAGCRVVKFQHRSCSLYNCKDLNTFDLAAQYIYSEIERTRISLEELKDCCNFARDQKLEVIVTPFDEMALQELLESSICLSALKIASCDLTNMPLIKKCADTGLPLILSTGMSYEREIRATSQFLQSLLAEHAFLHCNSTYPSPPTDINLAYISRLKEITKSVVGYSSHDGDALIPCGAIAHGARIVEFHVTRSHDSKGTDHRSSIQVSDLKEFVANCDLMFRACGNIIPRKPSQGELSNRQALGKSYAYKRDLGAGHVINAEDLLLMSPGSGYRYEEVGQIIKTRLVRDVKALTLVRMEDLETNSAKLNVNIASVINKLDEAGYICGIPVRYHDFTMMLKNFQVPMVEFHMSDRDLSLQPKEYVLEPYENVHLLVHAVEQYEDGFILDLASDEAHILNRSFDEIKRLADHVNVLRSSFLPADKIPVVLNIGGFTVNGFLQDQEYKKTLDRAINSLETINCHFPELEFLPQTMPPFPWHQGGRSYHNLLTSNRRIQDFLRSCTNNLCFDVSHTFMSCNHFGDDIVEATKIACNRISHVHLSDAHGTSAEGLEIGEGSVNFKALHNVLKTNGSRKYLIPEIWQGHLRGGEKFATSLFRFEERIG